MKPSYVNKKGQIVEVDISIHARRRFAERWAKMFPDKPISGPVDDKISELFERSNRVVNLSGREQQRMDRHGKDTIYFRTNGFTFVVQDRCIQTIEISDRGMRHLNRLPLSACMPL